MTNIRYGIYPQNYFILHYCMILYTFYPNFLKKITDISAISVTFRNSANRTNAYHEPVLTTGRKRIIYMGGPVELFYLLHVKSIYI